MKKEMLELQAARHSWGTLSTFQIQEFVDELLHEGVYTDEMLDVIYPIAATQKIVGKAFERALRALEVTIPDYEEAIWVVLSYHISKFGRKETDTLDGLKALIDKVYWR